MSQKGRLFVVSTPIGNLEDISQRARRVLGEVEAIACEDTRQTIKLLNFLGLKKRLISYFQPRERQKIPLIISLLEEGKDVALVSDAGTPGISDPGFPLIRAAIDQGIQVVPIPGPSALTAALSAAGLPTHRVLFLGFPPPKKVALKNFLQKIAEEEATLVFFLPMRKFNQFIEVALEVLGPREAVLAREITKVHEEFIRGKLDNLALKITEDKIKGEATLIIRGK
ncbi:MAG TPA: 16S rRNA (cytidine(1402)-2'-O)-methyltransferase [Candidatus Saccharicenans sp.]|jgi:16S rRNA (cytidine1402-2'-O)-methyltransferase|nr:16S rRNA (cytidine(1402)-2'-O)-methyltransferase [Candidatus Saccharicenans sp.]HOP60207.1 16S rRNA (cytidine(1402)-2'-O)-methyltransferase [Candidatus Saccharicenans sp.]HOT68949.1 16S rRNA (cytidine(1402)-2'-O)-methyltransferase [Candidatus Saccharicenans sp.]HPU92519.1 16S rRNA (cytidine(1402)-2'-O)-methyltransferase [Candidatus Saccharicenans sp.]HQE64249.1 16S rRNA (cytidine(1402)-2'-O)-methyltransferase [Candidatus Saccharicenans sp.]